LLSCSDSPLGEVLVARGLGTRVGSLRRIAREVGFCLLQCGFERAPIEGEKDLSLGDVITFGEVDRRQGAGDLGVYLDGGQRFDRADHLNVEWHRLLDDGGHGYWYWCARTAR